MKAVVQIATAAFITRKGLLFICKLKGDYAILLMLKIFQEAKTYVDKKSRRKGRR